MGIEMIQKVNNFFSKYVYGIVQNNAYEIWDFKWLSPTIFRLSIVFIDDFSEIMI